MTRGRLVWFAILAVGLAVGLLLRTPKRERALDPGPERRAAPASASGNAENLVEVEIADPRDISPPPRASAATAADPANESELLSELAATFQSNPARALLLAEQGERRFGESPRAVERRLFEIKALVADGRIGRARSKAERYLELYPPGPMTDEVEHLTGVHRRPPR
jgi:hypothetical protein